MAKIKLYIAATIDGYIARSNGDFDWLTDYPITPEINYGYDKFYATVGSIIMGGRTYHSILSMDVKWPYKGKECYVITRNINIVHPDIKLITDNIIENIKLIKEKSEKDIWLVGGGEIVSMLLNNDLIDEMIITTIPIILGSGIPLFPPNTQEYKWNSTECVDYKNGIIQVTYKK